MAIVGVESAVFGVEDLELCSRFWDDFGLVPVSRTADESVFEVASGSTPATSCWCKPSRRPSVSHRRGSPRVSGHDSHVARV